MAIHAIDRDSLPCRIRPEISCPIPGTMDDLNERPIPIGNYRESPYPQQIREQERDPILAELPMMQQTGAESESALLFYLDKMSKHS